MVSVSQESSSCSARRSWLRVSQFHSSYPQGGLLSSRDLMGTGRSASKMAHSEAVSRKPPFLTMWRNDPPCGPFQSLAGCSPWGLNELDTTEQKHTGLVMVGKAQLPLSCPVWTTFLSLHLSKSCSFVKAQQALPAAS